MLVFRKGKIKFNKSLVLENNPTTNKMKLYLNPKLMQKGSRMQNKCLVFNNSCLYIDLRFIIALYKLRMISFYEVCISPTMSRMQHKVNF